MRILIGVFLNIFQLNRIAQTAIIAQTNIKVALGNCF